MPRHDSIKVFPDSVTYYFNSDLVGRADSELIYPDHFRITLPPGLQYVATAGLNGFGYLYEEGQFIYIYIDRCEAAGIDTCARITNWTQISGLMLNKLAEVNEGPRFDIGKNPFNPARSSYLVKKGRASILLYNIRNNNIDRFLAFTKSFAFQP